MKHGNLALARDARHRPQHRVRAAAHHAHALAAMGVEAGLEHARHQALRADGAVLGGEVQREAHRLHLVAAARGPCAPRPPYSISDRATSRCAAAQLALHVERGQPHPARDQQIDAVGLGRREAGPERPEHIHLGPGQRTLEQRGAPTDGFCEHIRRSGGRRDRHQRESPGQQGITAPSASNHYELSRFGRRKRRTAGQPQNEVAAAKCPIFRDSWPGSSASGSRRLCTANVVGFLS